MGAVIVAAAVIWQGIGTAVVGNTVAPELSTFTTFSAFLTAAILANLIFFLRETTVPIATKAGQWRANFRVVAALNLFSAGAFCLFYISATMIQPTAASVIETGIGPLVVAIIASLASKRLTGSLIPAAIIVVLAFAFFFLGNDELSGMTLLGLALATAAGFSAVGVLYSSQSASKRGLGVMSIAAIRFHLAWIISGLVAFMTMDAETVQAESLIPAVVLSALCITFPILLLQWGVILAPPFVSALILAILPAVVMGTEMAFGMRITAMQFTLLSVIVVITLGQAILSMRGNCESKTQSASDK